MVGGKCLIGFLGWFVLFKWHRIHGDDPADSIICVLIHDSWGIDSEISDFSGFSRLFPTRIISRQIKVGIKNGQKATWYISVSTIRCIFDTESDMRYLRSSLGHCSETILATASSVEANYNRYSWWWFDSANYLWSEWNHSVFVFFLGSIRQSVYL